jgi:hypothetical protein
MAGSRLIGAVDTATLCVIEPIVADLGFYSYSQ